MTDVDVVPADQRPDVQLLPSAAAVAESVGTVTCHYCPETFKAPFAAQKRGAHEKKEHRELWEQNRSESSRRRARAGDQSSRRKSGTPPTSATRSASGGRQGGGTGQKGKGRPATAPRQSAAQLLTFGAQGLAQLIGMASRATPELGPVAAMVGFESQLVGSEGDSAVAGTALDRVVLQPALSNWDRFERVTPLVMAPLLIGVVSFNPALYDEARPFLRACLRPMLPALLAEMQRQQIEAEQLADTAAQLAELDPNLKEVFAKGGDPIDAILQTLFPAPPEPPADGAAAASPPA